MEFQILSATDTPTFLQKDEIATFLHKQLGKYGDSKEDIMKCLDYALSDVAHRGGFVLLGRENGEIKGVVVINKTGMEGFIPANLLVYIAVHEDQRGKGIGKQLMERALEMTNGGVALHVEPDNPARRLYEKLGFTNKYLEMRYTN